MQEQHPVPQQISSYQFRLVGDMTLKQFFELAGGCLIGLLLYTTSITPVIKWPLIIISVLFGIALAFLPFEDRPLEIWIVSFFRSVYSPTMYFWSKAPKEQYFQPETGQELPLDVIAPRGQAELNKYLQSKPDQKNPALAGLEAAEKGFLSRVTGLFGQIAPAPQTPAVTVATPTVIPVAETPLTGTTQNPAKKDPGLIIPSTPLIKAATRSTTEAPPSAYEEKLPMGTTGVTPTLVAEQFNQSARQAQFSISASPPMPPTQPNTLSGQVMDDAGRIIEAAILEIKDAAGRPVRAVKTNKLGHFFIVTPLSNGVYEILTEKEGYGFDPLRFTAEGNLIPPIAIRSKRIS